jgi:serine/threonine protein kinase
VHLEGALPDIDNLFVTVEQPVNEDVSHEVAVPIVFSSLRFNFAETATTYRLLTSMARNGGGSPRSLLSSASAAAGRMPVVEVRRRFRDIYRVLEAIKHLDPTALPELPEKRILNRFAPEFIESRRTSIEAFMNSALRSPFLCRHPQLQELLGLEAVLETAADPHEQDESAVQTSLHRPEQSRPENLRLSISSACFETDELSDEALLSCKMGTLLGKGTFGEVHLGLLTASSQLVAVKTVRVGGGGIGMVLSSDHQQENAIAEVQQELEVMRSLRHPNIVRFLGSLWNAGRRELLLFTEFVECGSVASMVRRFGPLPISVIQRYLRQILEGLSYLHGLRIVHRDIKGDNILVTKKGKVKLGDFGCSQVMAVVEATTTAEAGGEEEEELLSVSRKATRVQSLHGTPLFIAPELLAGDDDEDDEIAPNDAEEGDPTRRTEAFDNNKKKTKWDRHSFFGFAAADVWSVGCVGIEMLQREIWQVDKTANVFAVMFRIARAKSFPHGLPEEGTVPSEFLSFLRQCLQWNPARRPTAEQLLKHSFFAVSFESSTGEEVLSPRGAQQQQRSPTQHLQPTDPPDLSLHQFEGQQRDEMLL